MASLSKLQSFLHGDETLSSYERRLNDAKTTELARRIQRLQKQLKAYYLSIFGLIAHVSSHMSALFREDLVVSRGPTLDPLQYASSKPDDRYFLSFLPSVFNFFLTRSSADDFILKLEHAVALDRSGDCLRQYAEPLFLSPQFTFFVAAVFKPLLVPLVRKGESPTGSLLPQIFSNWKTHRSLCPCYIGSFISCLSEALQKSHSEILFRYFFVPLFEQPQIYRAIEIHQQPKPGFFKSLLASLSDNRSAPDGFLEKMCSCVCRDSDICSFGVISRQSEYAVPDIFRARLIDTDDTKMFSDKQFKGLAYQFFRVTLPPDDTTVYPLAAETSSAILRRLLQLANPIPCFASADPPLDLHFVKRYLVNSGSLATLDRRKKLFRKLRGMGLEGVTVEQILESGIDHIVRMNQLVILDRELSRIEAITAEALKHTEELRRMCQMRDRSKVPAIPDLKGVIESPDRLNEVLAARRKFIDGFDGELFAVTHYLWAVEDLGLTYLSFCNGRQNLVQLDCELAQAISGLQEKEGVPRELIADCEERTIAVLRPDKLQTEFRLLQKEAMQCFEADFDPLRKIERLGRALESLIDELNAKFGEIAENSKTLQSLFLWVLNPKGVISTFVFAFEYVFALPPFFGKHIELIRSTFESYLQQIIGILSRAQLFSVDLYGLIKCGRVDKKVAFFTGVKSAEGKLESEDLLAVLSGRNKSEIGRYEKKQKLKMIEIVCPNFLRPHGKGLIRYHLLTANFADVGGGELLGKNEWDLVVFTYNGRQKETLAFLKSIPKKVARKVGFALGGKPTAFAKVIEKDNWIELPREFLDLNDDDEKRSLLFEIFENLFGR